MCAEECQHITMVRVDLLVPELFPEPNVRDRQLSIIANMEVHPNVIVLRECIDEGASADVFAGQYAQWQ